MKRPLVEIIACSAEDCKLAGLGGADRIELCSAIEMGGLTPSIGFAERSVEQTNLPTMAMVRPRSGGFNYTDQEFDAMLADVRHFKQVGIRGIVFGILNDSRTFDLDRMKKIVDAADGMDTVCHRAFDVTLDPFAALESLIEINITRLLTSGQKPTALEGKDLIKTLVAMSDARIEILAGGGLGPSNVGPFVRFTGVSQVHLAAFIRNLTVQ